MKSGFPPTSPFRLPSWAIRLARRQQKPTMEARDRMQFVIQLALTNIAMETGGPFGAAVFETTTGRLVSIGVNLVASTNCSLAHAEMVALANAQQAVGHFDLGAAGMCRDLSWSPAVSLALCVTGPSLGQESEKSSVERGLRTHRQSGSMKVQNRRAGWQRSRNAGSL